MPPQTTPNRDGKCRETITPGFSVSVHLRQISLFRIGGRRALARFVEIQNISARFRVQTRKFFSHVIQV